MPQPRYNPATNSFVAPAGAGVPATLYAANGAIAITDGVHAITKTSAAAMTLAPPAAGDEGTRLVITARTAFAHTVVITEGIGGKGGSFDTLTFAAVGDSIHLVADNLHWVPTAAPYGVVVS